MHALQNLQVRAIVDELHATLKQLIYIALCVGLDIPNGCTQVFDISHNSPTPLGSARYLSELVSRSLISRSFHSSVTGL